MAFLFSNLVGVRELVSSANLSNSFNFFDNFEKSAEPENILRKYNAPKYVELTSCVITFNW